MEWNKHGKMTFQDVCETRVILRISFCVETTRCISERRDQNFELEKDFVVDEKVAENACENCFMLRRICNSYIETKQ